ncbi:unnamed protein product [Calypogeia fissa]
MLLNHCRGVMKLVAKNSVGARMVDISSMTMATKAMVHTLVLLTGFLIFRASAQSSKLTPMLCSASSTKLPCASYLFFISNSQSLSEIAANFNVQPGNILLAPQTPQANAFLINKTCACHGDISNTTSQYSTSVIYTPQPGADINLLPQNISLDYYGDLVYNLSGSSTQTEFQLICGCPTQGWVTMITYIVQTGDTLDKVSEMFSSNTSDIQILNDVVNADSIISPGSNLFIPTNFIPSTVATQEVTVPSSSSGVKKTSKKSNGLMAVAVVISAVVVLLVLIMTTACVYWWRRLKNDGVFARSIVEHSGASLSSGPQKPGGHCGRVGFFGSWFNSHGAKSSGVNDNVKRSITLPREAMDVFDQEKPIIFIYEEVIEATDSFNPSRLLGQGSYGAVYYGILRQQNVAIKQMKTTKSREFYAELKVLCKVHHTNLVELLGYSAGDDSLFLIYEFAENGALSQHLHHTEGTPEEYPPLSWTARVQIALDTARGLEYIHDHTKAHYVHRDVKTSNILLDGFFRAQVADFGLAKLVEENSETFITSTRFVGTYGYMPPECMQGGHTTSKSDVYAFGVVLFELITGRPAMSKMGSNRRSLISFMLEVLKQEHDPGLRFLDVVDPRLANCFPMELSFKMAKLARACVDEDPTKRPDMRTVVFSLSQFLLNSVEWEAAFGGRSSQIFSGLTQGR